MENYLQICEMQGTEPDPEEMPVEFKDLLEDTQLAFVIYYKLPDKWDGASGTYQGKELSILPYLLDLYEVPNKIDMVTIILSIIQQHSLIINEKMEKKVNNGKSRNNVKS